MFPDYLTISASELGKGTSVKVTVKTDMASIAQTVADDMLAEILNAKEQGREATLIVPVGPVDQFPILARRINQEKISLRDVVLINMDEYLTDDDQWIPAEHPLSFRGYMDRLFYDLLDPVLAPKPENRVFPHPQKCDDIQKLIDARGGVDATFGGIGINGHMAFNEPPEASDNISNEDFAKLPTRVLNLTRETRTINSVTVGGEISIIPWRCVTVGMKEILESRRMRFYCNRVWQSAVCRRVLHGPITAKCPASFIRTHPDASLTVADYVAQPPNIQLR
ncbi:MAG: Glucosamine-6-phosphate isomerase [Verrucomicrobiales bacterium]|nr:Glucosamine-6-phosphate isomerase [Verrucomicrobiales bacterium]